MEMMERMNAAARALERLREMTDKIRGYAPLLRAWHQRMGKELLQ